METPAACTCVTKLYGSSSLSGKRFLCKQHLELFFYHRVSQLAQVELVQQFGSHHQRFEECICKQFNLNKKSFLQISFSTKYS